MRTDIRGIAYHFRCASDDRNYAAHFSLAMRFVGQRAASMLRINATFSLLFDDVPTLIEAAEIYRQLFLASRAFLNIFPMLIENRRGARARLK